MATEREATPTRKRTSETDGAGSENRRPRRRLPAVRVARSAAEQLAELTGREPECVVGIEHTEDGWCVDLEVVESRRIPDSADILAIYQVEVDEQGDLVGYHRAARYSRGQGDRGRGNGGGR